MRTANLTVYDRDRNPIGELQFTNQQVRDAIERYDREYPSNDYPRTYETSYVKTWLENDAFRFAIRRRGRYYPPKQILRLAIGPGSRQGVHFDGGERGANRVLEELGFEVIAKPGYGQKQVFLSSVALAAGLTWSAWTNIDYPTSYDGCAVYLVRLAVAGEPASIDRFLGTDTAGLLCISQTGELEARRRKFLRALRRGHGLSEASLLHILERFTPLRNVYWDYGYEYSYQQLRNIEEAKVLGAHLTREYVAQFGEVPPLNSTIPERDDIGAWQAIS